MFTYSVDWSPLYDHPTHAAPRTRLTGPIAPDNPYTPVQPADRFRILGLLCAGIANSRRLVPFRRQCVQLRIGSQYRRGMVDRSSEGQARRASSTPNAGRGGKATEQKGGIERGISQGRSVRGYESRSATRLASTHHSRYPARTSKCRRRVQQYNRSGGAGWSVESSYIRGLGEPPQPLARKLTIQSIALLYEARIRKCLVSVGVISDLLSRQRPVQSVGLEVQYFS